MPSLPFPVSEPVSARVTAWLNRQDLAGRPLVLMHAGGSAGWPSKRWPGEYFSGLAQALSERGISVVWVGGDAERELNRRLSAATGVDATAVFSLPELVALGRHARLVLCNDSGPMHVLSMAGVPVYALFGPTDWRRSHALGQEGRVLRFPVECSPCNLPVCPPQRQHACLQGVSPGFVLARLKADGLL